MENNVGVVIVATENQNPAVMMYMLLINCRGRGQNNSVNPISLVIPSVIQQEAL